MMEARSDTTIPIQDTSCRACKDPANLCRYRSDQIYQAWHLHLGQSTTRPLGWANRTTSWIFPFSISPRVAPEVFQDLYGLSSSSGHTFSSSCIFRADQQRMLKDPKKIFSFCLISRRNIVFIFRSNSSN
jgi:hypothetical protein